MSNSLHTKWPPETEYLYFIISQRGGKEPAWYTTIVFSQCINQDVRIDRGCLKPTMDFCTKKNPLHYQKRVGDCLLAQSFDLSSSSAAAALHYPEYDHGCFKCIKQHTNNQVHLKRYGYRSFKYAAPALWNNLPESIKSSKELSSFKSSLKTYLFKNYFVH